ncbi:GNAT family N-acetyltransferase [Sinosporangium siamense]|uniref:N-acetyltransferase domain-containing protein n=1 Tax=Sinosporangium siamense TaxID=1367973 RepID=A0A919RB20_9ACTN|nr:GNAT family protein [Sinosporangium siamense]GII90666.1 hypothetical protein Ssi02_08970 [Sinosporangium siamense]
MLILHVETPRTALVPADAKDATTLYRLLLKLGLHSLPPLESFVASFDNDWVDVQFVVRARQSDETVGFASLQGLDPAGHIQAGIFLDQERAGYGVGGEAMMLLMNYAFTRWGELRKVYFMTTDASLARFGAMSRTATREATLPQHMFFRGRLWDVYIYSVRRQMWEEQGAGLLSRLIDGAPQEEPEEEYTVTRWVYFVESVKWLARRPFEKLRNHTGSRI